MAIPEIGTISDFEAGMNCLQNPSFISTSSSLSWGIQKLAQLDSLWKWGPLILALAVTFYGVMMGRIRVSVIGFSRVRSLASSEPLLQQNDDDDYDFSDDDTCSSVSSEDEDYESTVSSDDRQPPDEEDFCVAGSSYRQDDSWQKANLSPRRQWGASGNLSLAALATGKNVVKLWDSLALGLDLEDSSGNVVSIWDLIKDGDINSFFEGKSEIPSVCMFSPATMISAGTNGGKNLAFSAFDTRVGLQAPTMYAEWMPPPGKIVGIQSGGVEKVYVRHDVTGALTVGDLRNAKMPLENLTESGGDAWWDADAVNVQSEFSDHSR